MGNTTRILGQVQRITKFEIINATSSVILLANPKRRYLSIQNTGNRDCWLQEGDTAKVAFTSRLNKGGDRFVQSWPEVPKDYIEACTSTGETVLVIIEDISLD